MRNVPNQLIRENRPNYFEYKIQTTKLQKILVMFGAIPVECSGKNKRAYMKAKVNKLEENSKNKNIPETYKGINEFKKGYQARAYVMKKYDGTNVADTTSILSRWEQFQ